MFRGNAFRNVSKGQVALAVCALLAAGCAQEGKLVDTPLPVNGVSWDIVSVRDTTAGTIITKIIDVNFKVSVHAASACEAQRGLLELERTGPQANPTFRITPIARYNLDDRCASLPPGELDTVLTITVKSVKLINEAVQQFQVGTANGPLIQTDVDSTNHSPTAGTTRFEVRVEGQASGLPVSGANVTIERLGISPGTLGSGVTDVLGRYVLETPAIGPQQIATIPYRVTVTDSVTTRVISVPAFPARTQLRERVVVRL